ncbi:PREDICTED: selenoprotein K-like [Eufriesea mexicana]|uniref:selenoprotein K-like n=1 Tax=Eufriesea mexicana TaxID=516756 RepID=UPI00083C1ACB|nr:PREDICTED: selenoprotein K-like [Eufriesea mexicana]
MVYVSSAGNVLGDTPLYLKVYRFFTHVILMVIVFFKTLINPDMNKYGSEYTRDYRPGSGPPRPPTRRIGRPNTGHTIDIPIGGCRSCVG